MVPQPLREGPSVALPALSLRQPFASLVLYGVKQLEVCIMPFCECFGLLSRVACVMQARNRPALKQLSGPLGDVCLRSKSAPVALPLVLIRSLLPSCVPPAALHVSHREEPFGSPLVSTAVAILRRRYTGGSRSVGWCFLRAVCRYAGGVRSASAIAPDALVQQALRSCSHSHARRIATAAGR